MSVAAFRCPSCRVPLKPRKPLPVGKRLVCPYCESRFSLPAEAAVGSGPLQRVLRSRATDRLKAVTTNQPQEKEPPAPQAQPPSFPAPSSGDFRKLYRRFVLVWVATVVILSAGFGTALYWVMRDRLSALTDRAEILANLNAQAQEQKATQESDQKESEERRADFRRRMIQGDVALGTHHFEEAATAYQAALKLFPEEVEAAKGLSAARTSIEARDQVKKDEEKRQAEFARLMSQGQKALKTRQFAAAVQAFDNALRLVPADEGATKAFGEASAAVEAQQTAKKNTADYESHMTAARAAMVGQRYAEARNEFLAALQLKPEDKPALDGRRQAENRLNDLKDQETRQADFNRFMDQGDRALHNHRYEEAERAYTKAVKLFPRDLDANKGLREAQKGLEKLKQDFKRLIQQGDLAMQSLRFGDAVRAYRQATKLMPDDDGANSKLQTAQQALDDVANVPAAYNRLMLQGAVAMRLGRFGDAALAYGAALRLVPGDLDALAGLRTARAGMFGPPLLPVFP